MKTISVLIPVFNGEPYLAQAIDSVLRQTRPAQEIVIVDDGSTDGTAAVAQSFGARVNYHRQTHAGVAAARNHALAVATGDWLAFLDADDLWLPGKLAAQAARLLEIPRLQYVAGHAEFFLEPGFPWPRNHKKEWLEKKQLGFLNSFLGRREVFDRVGGFDPRFTCAEDIDWFARAKDLGVASEVLDEVVVRKRIHGSNITVVTGAQAASGALLRAMKNSVDRQRRASLQPA